MKKILFLILILTCFPIINADVISINSGGSTEIIISPSKYIEGFFSCTPDTCASLGYSCGTWSDGCGGTLSCGTCSSGYACTAGTCVSSPGGGGGGGGGSGGYIQKKLIELEIIPKNFNLQSTTNTIIPLKIDLRNKANYDLDIKVTITESLKNIISFIDSTSFSLSPEEIKTLNFQASSPSEAGVYTGKIIFASNQKTTQIPFVLNLRSGISLFDISLDIPEEDRIIFIGEQLKGQINLIQKGVQEPMDVSIHYIIKDYEDNVYLEESETIMVHKQKSYEHKFNTANLPLGDYVIGAEVIYSGGIATASYPFQIIEKEITEIKLIYIILIFLLILAIILIILTIRYYKKLHEIK